MKNIVNDKNTTHVNSILQKIEHQYSFEKGIIIDDVNYFLLFYELLRSINNNSFGLLQMTLIWMKIQKRKFEIHDFIEAYTFQVNNSDKAQKEYELYVHLNFTIDFEFALNEFSITRLIGKEKNTLNDDIKERWNHLPQSDREIEYELNDVYVFETKSNNKEIVLENFYSTLHLLKGIMEFSYNRFKWNFGKIEEVKNRKTLSAFKYPQFVYLRAYGIEDLLPYEDLLPHEDYPYDNDVAQRNLKTKGDFLFFKALVKLISEKQFDKGMNEMMSDCLRLYGMGIDTPYIDQSFLYFWNVLERVTLSLTGNTETVLNNIKTFLPKGFWEDNINSIEFLKKFRNNRVHRGVGEVNVLDVNLLKYLCDYSLYFLIGNPPGSQQKIKSIKQLEVFYFIKDNQSIDLVKDMVDLVVETRKSNNNQ